MPASHPNGNELTSWKEIAAYLGVTVRTAQKWEEERGLPVRRAAGLKGRISADPAVLDQWKKATTEPRPWWRSPRFVAYYAVLITAGLLAAAGIWLGIRLTSGHAGPPAKFHLDLNTLIVSDAAGRDLWRKTFEEAFLPSISPEAQISHGEVWFGDLDGDGNVEFLYTYHPFSLEKKGTILICLSETGEERWRFVPGRRVSTRIEAFWPPFLVGPLAVLAADKAGKRNVVLSSHHLAWYPDQVVLLSSGGAMLGEYWHSGHLVYLEVADLDGDGREEVLASGISNGHRCATLVVLDPRDLGGASLEENEDYQLQGFGTGKEKARILFPRSCINRKFEVYNWPTGLAFQGNSVRIQLKERPSDTAGGGIYLLDRDLKILHFDVSDHFRALHRELEAAGQLNHSFTDQELAELRNIRVLK